MPEHCDGTLLLAPLVAVDVDEARLCDRRLQCCPIEDRLTIARTSPLASPALRCGAARCVWQSDDCFPQAEQRRERLIELRKVNKMVGGRSESKIVRRIRMKLKLYCNNGSLEALTCEKETSAARCASSSSSPRRPRASRAATPPLAPLALPAPQLSSARAAAIMRAGLPAAARASSASGTARECSAGVRVRTAATRRRCSSATPFPPPVAAAASSAPLRSTHASILCAVSQREAHAPPRSLRCAAALNAARRSLPPSATLRTSSGSGTCRRIETPREETRPPLPKAEAAPPPCSLHRGAALHSRHASVLSAVRARPSPGGASEARRPSGPWPQSNSIMLGRASQVVRRIRMKCNNHGSVSVGSQRGRTNTPVAREHRRCARRRP